MRSTASGSDRRRLHVLVINAPNEPHTDASLLIEPIDVLTVASYIAHLGHSVTMRDMDRAKQRPAEISILLAKFAPDVVVIPFDYHIPLYTSAAIPGVRQMAEIVTAAGIRIVIGGRPASIYPGQFLPEGSGAVVVHGEMEIAIERLLSLANWESEKLNAIGGITYRTASGIVSTPRSKELFDLNRLPIPDRSLLDLEPYIDVRTLLSSRGCVERCGFCPVHAFWGKWRKRSPDLVVDEIEYLVREYRAKKILFLDDHAMADSRRMHAISRLILERGITVALGCLGTPRSFEPETIAIMQRAGFRWIHYGAEFGSDRVLELLRKRSSIDGIRNAVQCTKAAGIRVRTSWILDAPHSTLDELKATVRLILDLEPDEVRAHFLSLRAGAPFEAEAAMDTAAAEIPSQYIHAPGPQSAFHSLPREIVVEQAEILTSKLVDRGYRVIRESADWNKFSQEELSAPSLRFISFCPGRYGIGWSAHHAG